MCCCFEVFSLLFVMASPSKVPRLAPDEECPFGERCYRRNPHHFREYEHQHLRAMAERGAQGSSNLPPEALSEQLKIYKQVRKPASLIVKPDKDKPAKKPEDKSPARLTVLQKLERAQPFSFFLTKVQGNANASQFTLV